jgi:hypothetical protein
MTDTVDILRCQSNNYQITSGLYQYDNIFTIDLKKKLEYSDLSNVKFTNPGVIILC